MKFLVFLVSNHFNLYMLITTMNYHRISYYFYRHHYYYYYYALQVINNTLFAQLNIYYRCFDNPFLHCREQQVKCSHLLWLNTHIHTSRQTDSIFIFNIFTFILQFLLWSHTLSCWYNHCREQGKSSCYNYTGKVVFNYTW